MIRTLILLALIPIFAQAVIPPAGNELPAAERTQLESRLKTLADDIAALKDQPLLPDIAIYHKAVDWPLRYKELIDFKKANAALDIGLERAKQLKQSQHPWTTANGIRAYVSKIDGSIQPWFQLVPKTIDPAKKYRLDFFFHGRNEKLTELEFVMGKHNEAPENRGTHFTAFTYGRYCNANKFAGEIDTLEVLAAMKKQFPIDEDRVIITGFSMGGAACWHHAVHYADLFAAANPGAGFCETRIYQKMDAKGEWAALPEWQKQLMHLYDCPDYAVNLNQLPTIAYAGDQDPQKQSGDIMEKATAALGVKMQRVMGPNTAHKYEPEAKKELNRLLADHATKGRDNWPTHIRFATYTLRYNRMHWITVEGLEKHWDRATIDAKINADKSLDLTTANITKFSLNLKPGFITSLKIDGVETHLPPVEKPRTVRYLKQGNRWANPAEIGSGPLQKIHGLQGPIDDAFLDAFIIVKPTGTPQSPKAGAWAAAECDHAIREWRKIFRGEPRIKNDTDITGDDIASANLICFGDPSSNAIMKRTAANLPIKWDQSIAIAAQTFSSNDHALILIHPNPLNARRYIVLNSGFTFRQADHKTNSRQIAKLPDYAVIDLNTPPDDKQPGKIATAGFFNEDWKLP